MACSKLEARGHLLHKTGNPPKHFSRECKGISTMVNGTLLNFGKRYDDNLRVIFDQWLKLQLGLDALSNQNLERYSILNIKEIP